MSGSEVADQSKQQTDMLLGQCRVRAASKQEEEETRWGPARSSVQQSKRTFSPFLPRPSPEFQSGGGGEVDFEGLEKDRESKADPHLAGVGADGRIERKRLSRNRLGQQKVKRPPNPHPSLEEVSKSIVVSAAPNPSSFQP
ncbi:hypothetical protein AXG93_2278s1190 [Marchantia polymorpha subsp. ruderalis]|uniref:Uncharacterized protein n=1 Tax=Marchantia polymorpha subsp. ruderalis TaxID=1480154 RepID=A0A176WFQ2_MARPO|nr:hypothetical protein AXG93_2278s1190 [Marchantia polymorpha subsp. ruderalis]